MNLIELGKKNMSLCLLFSVILIEEVGFLMLDIGSTIKFLMVCY